MIKFMLWLRTGFCSNVSVNLPPHLYCVTNTVQGPRATFAYFDLLFSSLCGLQENFVKKKIKNVHFTIFHI
jgi:hypothetical protein